MSDQIIGDDLPEITRKLTELAKAGNIRAIKLCLERKIPVLRERTIELPLEPLEDPSDPPISHRGILIAIANSTITPAEGEYLSKIVTAHENSTDPYDYLEEVEFEEEQEEPEERSKRLDKNFQSLLREKPALQKPPEVTTPKPKLVAKSIPKPISQKKLEEQRMEQRKEELEKQRMEQRKEELEKRRKEELDKQRKEELEKQRAEGLEKLRKEEQRTQELEKRYREELEGRSKEHDLKIPRRGAVFS